VVQERVSVDGILAQLRLGRWNQDGDHALLDLASRFSGPIRRSNAMAFAEVWHSQVTAEGLRRVSAIH